MSVFFVVSSSASDCLERLVSEMTYYVSSGTLNPTHTLRKMSGKGQGISQILETGHPENTTGTVGRLEHSNWIMHDVKCDLNV